MEDATNASVACATLGSLGRTYGGVVRGRRSRGQAFLLQPHTKQRRCIVNGRAHNFSAYASLDVVYGRLKSYGDAAESSVGT
jgi:hypothetical protein